MAAVTSNRLYIQGKRMTELSPHPTAPRLVPAAAADNATIQNMARFYVYDMSRYCGARPGWECPDDGLFVCIDLKKYFNDADRAAFFIQVGDEKAGFVLVNKEGTTPDVDWNIGEFFVLAKFQNSGIGQQIAAQLFDRFPGVWEVHAMPDNVPAAKFWRNVIKKYAKSGMSEETKVVTDDNPKPHPMVVFRFTTLGGRN